MNKKLKILVFLSILSILILSIGRLTVKSKSPIPENKVPGDVESATLSN
jgi:hypothetical protein